MCFLINFWRIHICSFGKLCLGAVDPEERKRIFPDDMPRLTAGVYIIGKSGNAGSKLPVGWPDGLKRSDGTHFTLLYAKL